MKVERRLCYDPATREISIGGEVLKLPKKERELLVYLVEHPDVVHTRDELIEAVWGYDSLGQSSTLTVHINRLRKRLNKKAACQNIIETVWGRGYRVLSEVIK